MKCSHCFKNNSFISELEKLFLKKNSVLQKKAMAKLRKFFLKEEDFLPYLPLCKLYDKKLSFPKALEKFKFFKQPKIKKELFSTAEKKRFSQYIRPESKRSCLVFIDGLFLEGMSSFYPLKVGRLTAAWQKEALKEEDFGLLSLAFGEVFLFALEEGQKMQGPLQILHIITEKKSALIAPVIFFDIFKNTNLEVVQEVIDLSSYEPAFFPYLSFHLNEQASLQFTSLNLASSCWQNGFLRASLKEKAHFAALFFTAGGDAELQDIKAHLKAKSSFTAHGISFLQKTKQSYFKTQVKQEGHTISSQLYKSVLNDQSRFFIEGNIQMPFNAEGADGSFYSRNLLLSSNASLLARPFLEIGTDAVKAKHGMTSAEIPAEELFYLKSRGLSEKQAKQALLRGFCQEIQNLISINSVKASIAKAFHVDFKS